MFQNIFYTTYNLLRNISPCFNDPSSIPGLDGSTRGKSSRANIKYKIQNRGMGEEERQECGVFIGGQLQGSDGVREAIAAKCIGQEIIGRIHDVLY